MNILWDLRLFSYKYGKRGVGVSTQRMTAAILEAGLDAKLYIWGEKKCIPDNLLKKCDRLLDYTPQTWKKDLVHIPFIVRKYNIDIFHYWVGLGPIFRIGMGLFHGCKTCATIHDLGIAYWDDAPHSMALRKTWYWKTQKMLFNRIDRVVCASMATLDDVKRLFKIKPEKASVIYPPMRTKEPRQIVEREKRFITLGGAIHKNISMVITAFAFFKKTHADFTLYILGNDDSMQNHLKNTPGVISESMEQYYNLLASSVGLIFCSTHEGFGLPPIEAMANECPLILSDIPVLHETCGNAGRYIDPCDAASIAAGMEDVALNNKKWILQSREGFKRYRNKSDNSGVKWMDIYKGML